MGRFGLRGKLLGISLLLVGAVMTATALYVDNVIDEQLHALGAGEALYVFRWPLWVGWVIGLMLAVGMSVLATHLMSRQMRQLVTVARELGDLSTPKSAPVTPKDVSSLAGSFVRLKTELEESLEALARARDRFSRVVDAVSGPIVACNAEGHIIMVNRAARDSFALSDDAIGRPIFEFLRSPAIQELLHSTRPAERPVELPGPPRRIFRTHVQPYADGTRVLIAQDVTEVQRLETMRRDFVANVSHELRTPISVISANAETLQDGALQHPQKALRFVEAISRNVERLGALVENLLDLNRIETGQERTTLGPVNVRIACQNAIASLDPNAEKRGVTLRNETPEDLWVVADSGALDQVLVNLIDNALKYGADGGEVTVTAMEDGRFTRIMVEDDGPGIDPTHRDRVFERFYRIDRGRARHMGGTGIGLAIVKHLVESMGGTVGVEGVKPTGSRFWIRLNPPRNHNPPQPEL